MRGIEAAFWGVLRKDPELKQGVSVHSTEGPNLGSEPTFADRNEVAATIFADRWFLRSNKSHSSLVHVLNSYQNIRVATSVEVVFDTRSQRQFFLVSRNTRSPGS